eukprot:CAMPEP_0197509506 /NCGR_PEP_ID=MMETSP1312-20131121/41650_1 /TAXON_ID=464262 /ORGANISM="Genus nov. species nov., Strain RCC2335" /LENGTH=134 /DNA_ID=CAMNT_0043057381 /DNA_START=100 /DNA_END=504 /DNA_ORIENTATION=-
MEVFHGAGSVPSTNSVARDVVPAVELVDVQAQGPTEDLGKGGPRQGLEALGAQVGGRGGGRRGGLPARRGLPGRHCRVVVVPPASERTTSEELLGARLTAVHAHRPGQGWDVGQECGRRKLKPVSKGPGPPPST